MIDADLTNDPPPTPPTLALDGTLLLAADSYVHATSMGCRDPQCQWAFEVAATAFCNPVSLWYPTPAQPVTPDFPIFALWAQQGGVQPNLALTTIGKDAIIGHLRPRFRTKLADDTKQITDWIAFQFADEMTERYLSAGNAVHELSHFAEQVGDIVSDQELVRRIELGRSWNIPPALRDAARPLRIDSDLRLALAYTFQAFVKGFFYACGLHDAPSKPIYYPHWLRDNALDVPGLVDEKETQESWKRCFPWGMILSKIFSPTDPHVTKSASQLHDVFLALREHSQESRYSWVFDFAFPNEQPMDKNVHDALRDYVLTGLQRAKIVPKYKDSRLIKGVKPLLEGYASESLTGKIVYRVLDAILQAGWARSVEFKFRRTFRISTWKSFRDPGVELAIQRFHRNQTTATKKSS